MPAGQEVAARAVVYAKEVTLTQKEPTVENMIIIACREYGIDPAIPLAISRLETGNWTSRAFSDGNNVGGLSINEAPLTYDSRQEGVDAFVENLARNYFGEGLTSIEAIAKKYCPGNADEWAYVVNDLITLKGEKR